VAPPFIEYLADTKKIPVHIATRSVSKADAIKVTLPAEAQFRVTRDAWDVENDAECKKLNEIVTSIQPAVIVSLLPWIHHVPAAKIALAHGLHFCTASYVSDQMAELDAEVKEKNLFFLNECGVDPGLDHMSAQRVIDAVHAKGGKVVEFFRLRFFFFFFFCIISCIFAELTHFLLFCFASICGGLPAPSANTNPFGYKLSWSPRGVLLASRNPAQYILNGQKVDVPGAELYNPTNVRTEVVNQLGTLDWYLNRDSVKYVNVYKIPEVQTIARVSFDFRFIFLFGIC
jgi:saccharopine dehydrogenase (NADP+, L-glutamate forming)